MKLVNHLGVQALLEIEFPVGVEGVGLGLDFDVSFDGDICGPKQCHLMSLAFIIGHGAEEVPFTALGRAKILVFDPVAGLVGMATFGPAPEDMPEVIINGINALLADHVPVVVGPTS